MKPLVPLPKRASQLTEKISDFISLHGCLGDYWMRNDLKGIFFEYECKLEEKNQELEYLKKTQRKIFLLCAGMVVGSFIGFIFTITQ